MSVPTRNQSRKQTKAGGSSFLAEYHGPCPICRHTLNNPSGGRCPECGSRLKMVLLAPYRFTPWHAMLTSIGISTGVILDRVSLTIIGVINSGGMGNSEQMFWFTLLPLLILVICFLVVWKQRERINSTQCWKRICWYIASIIIPLVVIFVQLAGLVWLALHV